MAKGDDVARLPDDGNDDDEWCSVCGDDNIVTVLNGSTNCHYCGNQINLCSWCFGMMMQNIKDLKIADDYR